MVLNAILGAVGKLFGYNKDDFDYFEPAVSGAVDLGEGLEEANESAEKLKRGLRGFDKLNVITTPTNGSGTGGVAMGGIDPSIMEAFNKAYEEYQRRLEDVEMKATRIRDRIMEWLGFTKQINEETGEIEWIYTEADKTIKEIATRMSTELANALNILNQDLTPKFRKFGESLGNGISFALTFMNNFIKNYDWELVSGNIATFLNGAISTIDWAEVGKFMFSKYKISLKLFIGFVKTFDWEQLGRAIAEGIKNINLKEIFSLIGQALLEALKGLGSLIKGFFLEGGFYALFKGIAIVLGVMFGKTLIKNILKNITKGILGKLTKKKDKTSTGTGKSKGDVADTSSATSGFQDMLKNLGKASKYIAVLGGLALVVNQVAGALKTFSETGLSLGEALGFLGGTLAIIVAGIGGLVLVMKGIDLEKSIELIGILTSMSLLIATISGLLVTFSDTGISTNEVVGFMIGLFSSIVGLMGSVALLGPAMTTGLVPFLGIIGGVSAILIVMKETLPIILEAVGNFIEKVAPPLCNILDTIFGGITDIINALGSTLPPIINSIGGLFSNVFGGISLIVETLGSTIVNIMHEAGDLVDKVLKSILNFINELGPAIENFVDSAIKSVTKLINFLVSGIEYMINTLVINSVNGLLKKINNLIPGEEHDLKVLDKVKIDRFKPKLAKDGGLPDKGDVFIAGEKGAELVSSIGGHTFVANQSQMMSLLEKNMGKQSDSPQVFNIYLDENHKLGSYTLDQLKNMAKSNGKPITIQ